MNPTQANYRESRQQAIDAEIKSLEESIQLLKLRRNALQPISSLPPEIFDAIFSSSCLPGIPSLGGDPDRNRTRRCVTHVCHQWRKIALNQPQLWSHINFNTGNLVTASQILFRANLVPLYMEVRAFPGRDDKGQFAVFLKEVRAHLPHIRHVSIEAESFSFIHYRLENALVSPAPTLESLLVSFQRDDSLVTVADQLQVFDTLFGGSTPSLSCLKLRNCNISWNSPLFQGLKYLEIFTPHKMARPTLALWLDTLNEIPQLEMLTLHSASPVAARFPFDVERTVTLPSLTHLDISASLSDCALAAAHLDLQALTSLCLTAIDPHTNRRGVQKFLRYVVRHVYGPQDIRPLQSVLIRTCESRLELLAWPLPNIDTIVHEPPAFLSATLRTRVKLSFRSEGDDLLEVFETMMGALPLDGLLTLVAADLRLFNDCNIFWGELAMTMIWCLFFPNWPLLRRVRLGFDTSSAFMKALLVDRKDPLLPSLTELALAQTTLHIRLIHCLRDALIKRVEQGVPLETLDLRMCYRCSYEEALSEITIDILRHLDILGPRLVPEDTEESVTQG